MTAEVDRPHASDRPSRTARLLVGAIVGAVAWVLGYVLTYAVVAAEIRDSPLNRFIEALGGEPATYEMVGWIHLNAHFVDTVFRGIPVLGSHTTTFVGGDAGFTPLLYAIPAGLLLLAGAGLARYLHATGLESAILVGATAAPGYLLATAVGVTLFEVSVAGATGAPDLLPAIVIAGLLYPLVFPGIGAATVWLIVDRT